MREQEPFWKRASDNIWMWLVLSNVIFFAVYVLWGWLDVLRIPGR
jgi:hypothetical protein